MDLPSIGDRVRFRAQSWVPEDVPLILIQLLDYNNREAIIMASDYVRGSDRKLREKPLNTALIQYGEVLRVDKIRGYVDVKRRGVEQ